VLYQKRIGYNQKYKRFYFLPDKDQNERIILYNPKSGKRKDTPRTVVTFKTYGKISFFRHNAFEIKYITIDDQLHIILNPQYLFTSDGKNPLEDKSMITKFTNYMTAREFNQQILNHVHCIYSYVSDKDGKISICEIEDSIIQLSIYHKEKVKFGIPLDNNEVSKKEKASIEDNQLDLF
jgi:hypothetical protein